MFTKDGKQIILPTRVGKVKILYHILKAKVKFSYWLWVVGGKESLFANDRCMC